MNIMNRTIQFYKIKDCDIDMEPLGKKKGQTQCQRLPHEWVWGRE
jgi:hypothetical protein